MQNTKLKLAYLTGIPGTLGAYYTFAQGVVIDAAYSCSGPTYYQGYLGDIIIMLLSLVLLVFSAIMIVIHLNESD